jgi:DNA repair exonuclease SbcCD ATPase subunit/CheY-like chemotaxis protein
MAALEAEQAHLVEAYQQSEVIANQARQTAAEAVARSESLAAAYETASQEKDLLRSRVELLEADLRQTRLQADHAIHQHAEALMQLHNLEEALNARTRALQMAEQSLVELRERYEAAHHQMTGHISQLENQLAEAQQALSSREAEAKQLTVQLRELQDELATAQQARRDAQQTVETLQHDLASAQQLLSEAVLRSQTAERTVAEIEARAAKLLSEVIAAHEEQARLIKECEALEAALAASKAETERHVQAVKFFEAQVDALERALASSEVTRAALMQRMETLLEERVVWRRTLDHLEARLADRHLSVAGELASSDDEKPSGACPPAEVARLQELLAQRETVAVLQSRLDDLTKLNVITGAHRRLEDMLLEPSLPAQATSIVVVACDDEALRTQLATWCQQAGYQTNQVTNSDATLATLMLDPPQGIVLAGTPDHISTTYRRIRRNPDWRALPVVVITPKSFTGVSTSPSTWLLDEQAVSLSTLQRALRRWSMA